MPVTPPLAINGLVHTACLSQRAGYLSFTHNLLLYLKSFQFCVRLTHAITNDIHINYRIQQYPDAVFASHVAYMSAFHCW